LCATEVQKPIARLWVPRSYRVGYLSCGRKQRRDGLPIPDAGPWSVRSTPDDLFQSIVSNDLLKADTLMVDLFGP
jgi:hypothetical protein